MPSSLSAFMALRTAWWRVLRYDFARVTARGIVANQYGFSARGVNGCRRRDSCLDDHPPAVKLLGGRGFVNMEDTETRPPAPSKRRLITWLKRAGFVILAVLFVLACAFGFGITSDDLDR